MFKLSEQQTITLFYQNKDSSIFGYTSVKTPMIIPKINTITVT